MKIVRSGLIVGVSLVAFAAAPRADDLKSKLPPIPPKAPAEALKTFHTRDGFRLELVASEPQVTSPVAASYDEDGRLYVVEMRDYPDPLKPGETPIGRVRLLEDRDADGVYETARVFAEGLAWPTGVACWDGGVFVTAAPDLWYFKDTDGDGRADVQKKVFTGFVVYNVQALVNGLAWGVDNRFYGVTAGNGGEVRPADRPDAPPVPVRGRDFRFDPRTLKFEAVSGTAQFGNSFDDWYNRFVCANRLVAGHVVVPAEALARNPYLPAAKVIQDCAAEGENVPLPMFQVSPPEPWRDVRTKQYHAEGTKLPPSEMVATGLFTSGTGITIYRGAAYPERYRGNAVVGNVAGNLVHRRTLTPRGATFVAARADEKSEFVASTDNWFRPCNFVNAPDGTLHVLDMYREVVEHPWSIPENIKAHLDLTSGRDRGRIYRIAPPGFRRPPPPRLGKATPDELVRELENPNAWWRETAQRLLIQRGGDAAVPGLTRLARESRSPLARLHALWTLEGLGALKPDEVSAALTHPAAGLREHGLRLAEPRLAGSPGLTAAATALAADPDPRVRFQAALTLGNLPGDEVTDLLASIARRDAADPWLRLAVLSSAKDRELRLLERLLDAGDTPGGAALLQALAATIGPRRKPAEIESVLTLLADRAGREARTAVVHGLAEGLARSGRILGAVTKNRLVADELRGARRTAADEKAPHPVRLRALQLAAHAEFTPDHGELVAALLDPRQPQELQVATVRAFRVNPSDRIPGLLLAHWKGYSPAVKTEVLASLSGRPAWAGALLDAVAARRLAPTDIAPASRLVLLKHRDAKVQGRAKELLAAGPATTRAAVLAKYQPALAGSGDRERGLAVFKRECASCHYADGVGTAIGPAIAAVGTRTPDALLTAILDPNREIDPRYVSYAVATADGRSITGIVTAETATAVTLRGSTGATESVLRTEIDELKSLGVSLMPEGLEERITPAEMADLIAFLVSVK